MEFADDGVICSEPGEVEACPGDKNKSQEKQDRIHDACRWRQVKMRGVELVKADEVKHVRQQTHER